MCGCCCWHGQHPPYTAIVQWQPYCKVHSGQLFDPISLIAELLAFGWTDHIAHDGPQKEKWEIWYGESFIKMIYFHCKSCISQVNKKIGLTPLIALIWISCSFCIWWKRLKYKVSNKLRWRYNYYKISNICYLAIYYTIFISTVQQCSAHGGCTSRASASVVVELVGIKWITSALCYRSHLTRQAPLARSRGSTVMRVAR
jgi:hypothetical protein